MKEETIEGNVAKDFHKDNVDNPERYNEFVELVRPLIKGLENPTIIDLGCGSGVLEVILAKEFPNAYFIGLDISSDMIKIAKEYAKGQGISNLEFRLYDLNCLVSRNPFPQRADVVISRHTFHRLNNLLNGLKAMANLTKTGGKFLVNSFVSLSDIDEEGFKEWIGCLRERNDAPLNQMAWALAHYSAPSLEDYQHALNNLSKKYELKDKRIWVDNEGYGCKTVKIYAVRS